MKQVVVAECEACEEKNSCYSIPDERCRFEVHTHSDQYKGHLLQLEMYAESVGHTHGTSASALDNSK